MKFYKIILTCTLATLALTFCTRTHPVKQEDNKLTVAFDDNEYLKFSDYFENPEFILLETRENNLFREITEIQIKDSIFYIFSCAPDNMVSFYKHNGEFINNIHRVGRGPGEINYANSFDLNDNFITVLDRGNKKLVSYDLEGNYINETKLDDFYTKFSYINDRRIILFEYNPYNDGKIYPESVKSKISIYKYDENLNLKKIKFVKGVNEGKRIQRILTSYYFINKDLYYWDVYNDSIMSLNLDNFESEVVHQLDFGQFTMPPKLVDSFKKVMPYKKFKKIIKEGYASIDNYIYCNSGLQLFSISRFSNYSIGIIKKNEEILRCYSKLQMNNLNKDLSIDLSKRKFSFIHVDNKNNVYFEWKTSDFIKTFKDLKLKISPQEWKLLLNSNKSLMKLIESVSNYDNPIILKVQLKD